LEKNHSLKLSKYKLWKALHELGFRYAKINGNKKALVERKDLVNKVPQVLFSISYSEMNG
jgi:transposase